MRGGCALPRSSAGGRTPTRARRAAQACGGSRRARPVSRGRGAGPRARGLRARRGAARASSRPRWPAWRRPRPSPRAPARGSRARRGAPPSSVRSLRGASTSARRDARPPPAARCLRPSPRPGGGRRRTSSRSRSLHPSRESLACTVDQRLRFAVSDRRDETELVAAEPVHGACLARDGRELRAQPDEQGVSRRMTEAVVVALEAVEVEEHEERRRHGLGVQTALEICEELSAVREACEGIGRGLRRVSSKRRRFSRNVESESRG